MRTEKQKQTARENVTRAVKKYYEANALQMYLYRAIVNLDKNNLTSD